MANDNCKLCNTFHPYTKHAQITAGDLTTHHLGVRLCITQDTGHGFKSGYQGTLLEVEHGANRISERSISSATEHVVLGQRWVQFTMLANLAARVSPEATVELLG